MITTSKLQHYRNCLGEQIETVYTAIQAYKKELQKYSEEYGDVLAKGNVIDSVYKSYICKSIEYARLKGVYQTLIKAKTDLRFIEGRIIDKRSRFSIGKYVINMTKRALRKL